MSKYRYWWRPNVERDIRSYPKLKEKKAELQKVTITPAYEATIKGSLPSRTTENTALRQLPPREDQIVRAVELAIEAISRQKDGREVLEIVRLVDWKRSHTIEGASYELHMSVHTAIRRRTRFLLMVAKYEGYLQ